MRSPTDGLSPLYDMRCKLTAAEKEIERLRNIIDWIWASCHQDVTLDQIRDYLREALQEGE